jgi:FlaA1/EpsC-like NDP-sugar epimerase
MDTSSILQSASIAQFYANKNILITGATGNALPHKQGQ